MNEENWDKNVSIKGWLLKWTNYMKGYRRRWFVLTGETLSYYQNSTEVDYARGSISLYNAVIHPQGNYSFIVSNNETKTVFHLRTSTKLERARWLSALEEAKDWASDNRIDFQWQTVHKKSHKDILKFINSQGTYLETLQKYQGVVHEHGHLLKHKILSLRDIYDKEYFTLKTEIKDLAKLFQITSNGLINACTTYIEMAMLRYRKADALLREDIEQRKVLEELERKMSSLQLMLVTTVRDQNLSMLNEINSFSLSLIKRSGVEHKTICCSSKEEIVLLEAEKELSKNELDYSNPKCKGMKTSSDVSQPVPAEIMLSKTSFKVRNKRVKDRRTRVPDKPNYPLSLWSIMKNCIGKDLSKIPMPVNFSEPLSFLQRVAEDFAYSYVLDEAALCEDSYEQLAHLAAFAVSCYSTTALRTAKPFNPLLGETFEFDRTDDLGWRLISEQVSHHPPISAQYCESSEWTCWQEFAMQSKFRGKYLMVIPLGISHIIFHKSRNHYSWTKVTTTVNNIIIGKLWVDNTGTMSIVNHSNSSKCNVDFFPYSLFRSDDYRKVAGEVTDHNGVVKWVVNGKWDSQVSISPVIGSSGKPDQREYKTGNPKVAWIAEELPDDSEKYYNFSIFTSQLNETEDGVAPTDSRLRPDQRLMEEGNWDEANIVKSMLEEKQRAKRKNSLVTSDTGSESTRQSAEERMVVYQPTWFKTDVDDTTGRITYVYSGGYWEAKENNGWDRCPNLYT